MEKKALTAQGLVEYVLHCKNTPHIYVWDVNGEYITDELLDRLSAQYPDWYTPERLSVRRTLANRNIRGWDCIGLIKSYVWGDYTQLNPSGYSKESDFCTRTLIEQPLVKGLIADLPEKPGLVLWKKGHVGIYIGSSQVIECTHGTNDLLGGIKQTPLHEKIYEYWLEYPGIQY